MTTYISYVNVTPFRELEDPPATSGNAWRFPCACRGLIFRVHRLDVRFSYLRFQADTSAKRERFRGRFAEGFAEAWRKRILPSKALQSPICS